MTESPRPGIIAVAANVASIVRPAVLAVEGARVVERDPRMDEPLAIAEQRLREAGGESHDVVAAVRAMYRRIGLDPTRRRPSSEALLRRIRRGEPLPRVNSVVDIGNWCSVETHLPYGLYDLERVSGNVTLRLGEPGEEYPGIGKEVVHVAGRLTIADALGPFGNPSSDSARTMVTCETTHVLTVIYAPAELKEASVERAAELTAARLREFAGGAVIRIPAGQLP